MSATPCNRRSFSFSVSRNGSTFYWGGTTWDGAEKKRIPVTDLNRLHEFNVKTREWRTHELKGRHPPGIYDGACAAVGDVLYLYGGLDGNGRPTGSLFELNLMTMSWNELSHPGTGGPVKKYSCGMVNNDSALILFGGFTRWGKTNELHVFHIHSGKWSSPTVTGDAPAPDALFTFTKVSNHQVVLHGGRENKETYVLDLSEMHWERRDHSESKVTTGESLVAVCLGLDGPQAQLLLLDPVEFRSPWLLDLATWKWMELDLPSEMIPQLTLGCSVTAAKSSSDDDSVNVVVFGEVYEEVNANSSRIAQLVFQKKTPASEDVPLPLWFLIGSNLHFKMDNNLVMDSDNTGETEYSEPPINSSQNDSSLLSRDNIGLDMIPYTQEISATSSELPSEKTEGASASNTDSAVRYQEDFARSVIEAVDYNKQIERKMASIILKGLPETGKSTLLDRLLGRPFKERHLSTGMSENVVVVDVQPSSTFTSAAVNDNSSWQAIDFDTSIHSQLGHSKDFLQSAEKPVEVIPNDGTHIRQVLRKHNIKGYQDLKNKNSLYIRDTGGQVEFQESLALLINGSSVFFFVLKVNVDFCEKTTIRYRSHTSGKIFNEYESTISTEDALIQFLSSVSAVAVNGDSAVTTENHESQEGCAFQSHKPIVFIVGTHIDLLESTADSIAKMNESLHNVIQKYDFSDVVRYADSYSSKVMFTVDNTCEEDQNFKILRSAVDSYIGERHEFTVVCPVKQLLFCLELQNVKKTFLSIDEFKLLASKFSIAPNEICRLLHFLHFRIGIVQHYDVDKLANIVIKEPQVFFNKVTDLLVKTFLSSSAVNRGEQTSFSQKGILEASTIKNIIGKHDNISPEQFLAFIINLHLAVPFIDESGRHKCFIPSVLNHIPPVLNHITPSACGPGETKILPLSICFGLGHCPYGVFGLLISHLLKSEKNREITFTLSEDKIYQDQVSFLVYSKDDIDEISIKRHPSHIEVTMFLEESSSDQESQPQLAPRSITPAALCTTVLSILEHYLQRSLKTLRYDNNKVRPRYCLTCPISNCGALHEVRESHFLYCKPSRKKLEIPLLGKYWFSRGEATELSSAIVGHKRKRSEDVMTNLPCKQPCRQGSGTLTNEDLHTLYDAIFNARMKWYEIGLQLKVNPDTLDSIEVEEKDNGKKLLTMLKNWLRAGTDRSLKALDEALRNKTVARPDVADNLHI